MGGRGSSSGKKSTVQKQLESNEWELRYAQNKYSEYAKAANYSNKPFVRDGMDEWHKEVLRQQRERDELQKQLTKPFEPSGRGYWGKQIDADTKRKAAAEKKIADIDKKLKQGQPKKAEKKPESKPKPTWQRAGEGWYIGKNGHEIRENYDSGGYDVVKVSGRSAKVVKHFSKLSQAKKYNP